MGRGLRERANVIERAVALAHGDTIAIENLPDEVRGASALPTVLPVLPESGFDLDRMLADIEREAIAQAMRRTDGVKTRAAELLGVSFRSLRYRMKRLGVAGEES